MLSADRNMGPRGIDPRAAALALRRAQRELHGDDNVEVFLNAATGAQLATPAARVIDPVLTTAARGYRNAMHIHSVLFPRVETMLRGGTRIEFDRTDFRKVNSRRAPGSGTKQVQFGHEGILFALEQHRLEGKLPVENAEESMRVPGIDLGMRTVDGTLALISLAREIHAGELACNAASYKAAHVEVLAGDSQWDSAASDPTGNIVDAVETIRRAIGMRARTVVLGGKVYSKVRKHPKVLQQIRYDGGKQIANAEDLAKLWDVERVVPGDAIYADDADETHDIWGNCAIVAYTPTGSLTRYEPSFGYGYTLSGTPMAEAPYYDRNHNSWLYPACEEWSNEIVGQDAGVLITDVLADF